VPFDGFTEDFFDERRLPLVLQPNDSRSANVDRLVDLVTAERDDLRARLLCEGAILFRGFAVDGASAFGRVVDALDQTERLPYVGGDSPRTRVGGANIYTSTECPAHVTMPMHHEMSYLASFPRHLFFHCEIAAERGGETPLADARAIYRALHVDTRARFEARGVRYVCTYSGTSPLLALLNRFAKIGKSWREAFETDDRTEAERRCAELGIEWRWMPGERLQTITDRPATLVHPETGEHVWFNQAHAFRMTPRAIGAVSYTLARLPVLRRDTWTHHALHADGSEIDGRDLDHVLDVLADHRVSFSWRAGDVLVADNLLVMHGRNAFHGPRRILVAMTH
jgi:alpha-ketoglutarate-dependent taurine dioxygenase